MLVAFCLFIFLLIFKVHTQQFMWDYNEPGKDWVSTCNSGFQQSPIDFPSNFTFYQEGETVKVLPPEYGPFKNNLLNGSMVISSNRYVFKLFEYNGSSIQITKNGTTYTYDLIDVSFHVPSEHRFVGLVELWRCNFII